MFVSEIKESNPRNVANPVLLVGNQSGSVCGRLKIIRPRGLQVSASERALFVCCLITSESFSLWPSGECESKSTHV